MPRQGKSVRRESNLGRSLTKRKHGPKKVLAGSEHAKFQHTTDVEDDGPGLRSVTEVSSLEEFIGHAAMAEEDFAIEHQNAVVLTRESFKMDSLSKTDQQIEAEQLNLHKLLVPRRPEWTVDMAADELNFREREAFLEWRRALAEVEENKLLHVTPFEKNLEVWRQLWRVVERSDIVVQIVDARNPLLFRCEDLELYSREVAEDLKEKVDSGVTSLKSTEKRNLLIINKADLLSQRQRMMWAEHFSRENVDFAFFSAAAEAHLQAEEEKRKIEASEAASQEDDVPADLILPEKGDEPSDEEVESTKEPGITTELGAQEVDRQGVENTEELERGDVGQLVPDAATGDGTNDDKDGGESGGESGDNGASNEPGRTVNDVAGESFLSHEEGDESLRVLGCDDLVALFRRVGQGIAERNGTKLVVGMVGYPNVGKSSTINVLCRQKKVAESATPGKTKHFQTIHLCEDIILCDCPGLVFPSFVSNTAEMVCNGLLPIDQLRDPIPPISLVCKRISREVLCDLYGMFIERPASHEDQDRPPTAHELLNAHARSRGFMAQKGMPDQSRSARVILKDYVRGRLLWCSPPTGVSEEEFNSIGIRREVREKPVAPPKKSKKKMAVQNPGRHNKKRNKKARRNPAPYADMGDDEFFEAQARVQAHTKGRVAGTRGFTRVQYPYQNQKT